MDGSGAPTIIRTVAGGPETLPAAIAALKQWRFEPSSHSRVTLVAFNMEAAKSLRDPSDLSEPRKADPCTGGPQKIADFRPPVPKSIRVRRVVQVEILRLTVDRTGAVMHAYAVEPVSDLTRRALDAVMRWRFSQSRDPVSMTVTVAFDGTERSSYVPGSLIGTSTKPGSAEAVRFASGLAAPSLSARHGRRTTRFVYGDFHRANTLFMTVRDVALLPAHVDEVDRQDDVLTGRLDFDERGQLLAADFYGPLVSEPQRIGMIRTLNEHPEWSTTQARNAFVSAKPRNGPDDKNAFVDALQRSKLDRVLGHGALSSVRFVLRDESGPLEGAARVVWTARFHADAGRTYELEFEPYGGRLVRLARVDPE
jgi:hypothetical protein